jgi:acetyl esterase/lipase
MGKYNLNKDLLKYQNQNTDLNPALLPIINRFLAISFRMKKIPDNVIAAKIKIPGYKDAMISITVFEPKGIEKNAPCLIYYHGGAFSLKAAPYHKYLIGEYASKTPCKVVFVDYRLTPKYAFPIGVEDCYTAFEWVYQHADELEIDNNRIAIGGDSAGGALSAAVTQMARDRKAPRISFQMLVYPVTDARQNTETIKKYIDTPLWDSKANSRMWELYLSDRNFNQRAYASPMEATSFVGLPDAYVEVSEFDCLRDEGIFYAEALEKSGCEVEINKTIGTIHGFELAEESEITSESVKRRVKALQRAFYSAK